MNNGSITGRSTTARTLVLLVLMGLVLPLQLVLAGTSHAATGTGQSTVDRTTSVSRAHWPKNCHKIKNPTKRKKCRRYHQQHQNPSTPPMPPNQPPGGGTPPPPPGTGGGGTPPPPPPGGELPPPPPGASGTARAA